MNTKMLRINIIGLSTLLLICLFFFYLNNNQSDNRPHSKVLGLVVMETEDEWQENLIAAIEEKAKEYGFETMKMHAERNQAAQIEAVRALIVYQVDTVVFFPIVESGWDRVLLEAQENYTHVIAVDKAVRSGKEDLKVGYVGYDYYEDAYQAAELLADQAQQDDVIVELYGTVGSYAAKEITRGFREGLDKKGLKIKSSLSGDYMRSRGKEIIEGFLKSEESVDFIISHNDAMTLGAVEAVEQAGKIPGKDVHIFAVGGGDETTAMVKAGQITCLIQHDARAAGAEAVELVQALQTLETQLPIITIMESAMLTKENYRI